MTRHRGRLRRRPRRRRSARRLSSRSPRFRPPKAPPSVTTASNLFVIDSLAHVYSPDERAFPPISNPRRPLPGAGTLKALRAAMDQAGVAKAVLVQTTHFYGWDNTYLASAASGARTWAVGVCRPDPCAPSSGAVLRALVANHNVAAVRIAQVGGRLDCPANRRMLSVARELAVPVDILADASLGADVARLAGAYPDVRLVLDHCLVPAAGAGHAGALRRLVELAGRPNLHAKLTFLPVCSAEPYPFRDLHPAVRAISSAFGPDRCAWGSLFPLSNYRADVDYLAHLELFRSEMPFGRAEAESILGATAARLYFGG